MIHSTHLRELSGPRSQLLCKITPWDVFKRHVSPQSLNTPTSWNSWKLPWLWRLSTSNGPHTTCFPYRQCRGPNTMIFNHPQAFRSFPSVHAMASRVHRSWLYTLEGRKPKALNQSAQTHWEQNKTNTRSCYSYTFAQSCIPQKSVVNLIWQNKLILSNWPKKLFPKLFFLISNYSF